MAIIIIILITVNLGMPVRVGQASAYGLDIMADVTDKEVRRVTFDLY